MTLYEYINENIDRIKVEIKMGLISTSIISGLEIYSRYKYYTIRDYKCSLSVLYTAQDFNISNRWVYKIIKLMEQQYEIN